MAEKMAESLTKQEKNNMKRILAQQEASMLLAGFLNLGFRNYTSFKSICQHYDSSLGDFDLIEYWRLRKILPGMNERVSGVLAKLKTE